MKIETFIEKFHIGLDKPVPKFTVDDNLQVVVKKPGADYEFNFAEMLLDPEAWQAVGKVEGWWFDDSNPMDARLNVMFGEKWQWQMHKMIDALAEGKTIEEFIETL